MSNKIYYEQDCNLALLEGKTIAVIGYGSQLLVRVPTITRQSDLPDMYPL